MEGKEGEKEEEEEEEEQEESSSWADQREELYGRERRLGLKKSSVCVCLHMVYVHI